MGYAVYARRLALDHAVYAIWLAVEWSMRWVGREVRRIGNERTRERERERERGEPQRKGCGASSPRTTYLRGERATRGGFLPAESRDMLFFVSLVVAC